MPTDFLNELPPLVVRYITDATRDLKPVTRQREVVRELASHALEISDELKLMNRNDEEIANEILKRWGDVMALNQQFVHVHSSPIRLWFLRISGALLSLAVIGVVGLFLYWQHDVHSWRESNEQTLIEKFPAFEATQNEWSRHPFFAARKSHRDAGEVLNSKIHFAGDASIPSEISEEFQSKLTKATATETSGYRSELMRTVDVSKFDLSWMKSLKNFDEWDPYSSGKGKELSEKARRENVVVPPAFAYRELMAIPKIRIIQGYQNGDLLDAIDDIENYARLLGTTEQIIPFTIATSLYFQFLPNMEEKIARDGFFRKPLKAHLQPALSPATFVDLRTAVRVFTAVMGNTTLPEKMASQIHAHPEWRVGRCAAIAEAQIQRELTGPYFTAPRWPFESDLSRTTNLQQEITAQAKDCRLTWWHAGGEPRSLRFSDFDLGPANPSVDALGRVLEKIPYVRRTLGLVITRVFNPGF